MGLARDVLRIQILKARGAICAVCGESGCEHGKVSDLHEEFVSRKDVMCLPKDARDVIFDEHNCAYVCNWVNLNMTQEQHARVRAYLIGLYGRQEIEQWVNSLQMKLAITI